MPNIREVGEALNGMDPELLTRAYTDVAAHVIALAQGDWPGAKIPTLQAEVHRHVPTLEIPLGQNMDMIEMAALLPDSKEKTLMMERLKELHWGMLVFDAILGRYVELEKIQEGSSA